MAEYGSYARSHLKHATPGEIAQFRDILAGRLPAGFDARIPGDWLASVGRIKAASDARARAAAERPWTPAAQPAQARAAEDMPELPRMDRAEELRLVRLWMAVPPRAAGSAYFPPSREP